MFFGFEGTGMTTYSGQTGLNDWSNSKGFIWKSYMAANFPNALKRYFPGPNIQGNNCDLILQQAIDFFEIAKKSSSALSKITLFGYSRGAYIAMCFAKYLEKVGVPVLYLGMFDAVSQDFDNVIQKTHGVSVEKVPRNVKYCYHASRSRLVGSRSETMNYVGRFWENEYQVNYLICPGSHASMGGFPNDAGTGDGPNKSFGDPDNPKKFDPKREFTAWFNADRHVTTAAVGLGLLKCNLIERPYQNLLPQTQWDWDNKKLYNRS
jgi:hypothetical protein